ncbi:F-box domain-containing protein [Phyllosticta capitalensis]
MPEQIMDAPALSCLPSELLLQIFDYLATKELLRLTTVSHRVHDIIIRIIRARLDFATHLYDHGYSLDLSSSDPVHLYMEPAMDCIPQETEDLEISDFATERQLPVDHLGQLKSRYSRFRLHRRDFESYRKRARPGDIPGSRTHPSTAEPGFTGGGRPGQGLAHQRWTVDGIFFQLCVSLCVANKRTRFKSMFYREIVRVSEEWLNASTSMLNPQVEQSPRTHLGKSESGIGQNGSILWCSGNKHLGLRLRVRPHRLTEEEKSFDVDYEEVLVRTSHLLLTFESSLVGG